MKIIAQRYRMYRRAGHNRIDAMLLTPPFPLVVAGAAVVGALIMLAVP